MQQLLEAVALESPSGQTVQRLLHAVRRQISMPVAWIADFVGGEQVFRVVDADPGAAAPTVGTSTVLSGSFCARVVDGRAPQVIADARREPAVALLDVGRDLHLGSYLGVPLLGPDGSTTGMLCAASPTPTAQLGERDVETLRLLAGLLHDLHRRTSEDTDLQALLAAQRAELLEVVAGQGRRAVLQPVFEASSGAVFAMEGLSRFDGDRNPAHWFQAAARHGLAVELELAAAQSCLDLLDTDRVPEAAAVSLNVSPDAVLAHEEGLAAGSRLRALLDGRDLHRVILEITEHRPVEDYDALARVLDPLRERGVQLAIDDAGAGYASLRHVLMFRPDIIKLDMALVRGIDGDEARDALVRALIGFAGERGIAVVAEGVETAAERATLQADGVHYLQGFLLGRPA